MKMRKKGRKDKLMIKQKMLFRRNKLKFLIMLRFLSLLLIMMMVPIMLSTNSRRNARMLILKFSIKMKKDN